LRNGGTDLTAASQSLSPGARFRQLGFHLLRRAGFNTLDKVEREGKANLEQLGPARQVTQPLFTSKYADAKRRIGLTVLAKA
jgi:hypothetical protein